MSHVIIIWWTFKHDQSMIQIQVHVTLKRLSNPWFVTWVRHSCQKLFLWHKNMSLWTYSNWYLQAQWRIQHLPPTTEVQSKCHLQPSSRDTQTFPIIRSFLSIFSEMNSVNHSGHVASFVNSAVFFGWQRFQLNWRKLSWGVTKYILIGSKCVFVSYFELNILKPF